MSKNLENDQKKSRKEYPSGWVALVKNESVVYMIDALLDLPSHREFNKSELAELAGVSRQSVGTHIETLEKIGIVEGVEGTRRYRFNPNNE
ncbi:MAG: HTH domain-containing protein, partial [Halobacteria archaeon]|nr:HTH domain-containing protein [Halobacteria archaeon]